MGSGNNYPVFGISIRDMDENENEKEWEGSSYLCSDMDGDPLDENTSVKQSCHIQVVPFHYIHVCIT